MTEQDTRQKLISAAKSEFLANGYKGASLRRICANAGVTTGALYFFFKGKEDLFGAIVDKPMAQFQKLTAQSIEMELNDPDAYAMIEDSIIRFLLTYRDECILVLDKAEGTKYAAFRENWEKRLENTFGVFFEKYLSRPADPAIVRLIASMRMHGYMELLHGNYTEEHSRKLVNEMAVYADAGFSALIKELYKEM